MRFRLQPSAKTLTISVRGWSGIVLVIALLCVPYLLSQRYTVTPDQATELIRHNLRYQSSQRYAELYRAGKSDARTSQQYQEELAKIDRLRFESVKIGRLFPDYVFSVRPTFYVKVVIQDDHAPLQTRYFNLGRGHLVLGETSKFLWAFVL